ncbi:MAG: hypothetical protein ONA90_05205, partial [candidate division KSB1 bacterium]|nr:hypothetical protein [candidate division KSB1 bacterium]
MLDTFDWLRLCRTGAELLATARFFSKCPASPVEGQKFVIPFSALNSPCQRCYIFARDEQDDKYCRCCKTIVQAANRLFLLSKKMIVISGFLSPLPQPFLETEALQKKYFRGRYIHDENRFLLMMHRRKLKSWLQELVIYYGPSLIGFIQIFPAVQQKSELGMGEILCWAAHHQPSPPFTQLHVQFYASPFEVIKPSVRRQQGVLNFEGAEFLHLLEMAEVFRAMLRPEEQQQLRELLKLDDPKEESFYWGRFLGQLPQQTKDMLAAWRIRQWP